MFLMCCTADAAKHRICQPSYLFYPIALLHRRCLHLEWFSAAVLTPSHCRVTTFIITISVQEKSLIIPVSFCQLTQLPLFLPL